MYILLVMSMSMSLDSQVAFYMEPQVMPECKYIEFSIWEVRLTCSVPSILVGGYLKLAKLDTKWPWSLWWLSESKWKTAFLGWVRSSSAWMVPTSIHSPSAHQWSQSQIILICYPRIAPNYGLSSNGFSTYSNSLCLSSLCVHCRLWLFPKKWYRPFG